MKTHNPQYYSLLVALAFNALSAIGSVEKVLVLSVVMYKWGGHERSWTCAICPCGVGSEPGSCTCLQSSFFSAAFHSAAVVSDFMFDALRGLDVSRSGSSSGRAW